mmetsp:Transcript_7884/g.19698  ORF Transcript_7884/g.19698 Transcript_7884/m.19698 type:complete len:133 (-) Transcript_7884:2294-2692(-)
MAPDAAELAQQLQAAAKKIMEPSRQVLRLKMMWADLKDFLHAAAVMLLGPYYNKLYDAYVKFTWRLGRYVYSGMVLKQRAQDALQQGHAVAMAWAGQRVDWEEERVEQALLLLYTALLAVALTFLLRASLRR